MRLGLLLLAFGLFSGSAVVAGSIEDDGRIRGRAEHPDID